MIEFYSRWLSVAGRDPAEALRETKKAWATSADDAKKDPRRWAPYVIIGR